MQSSWVDRIYRKLYPPNGLANCICLIIIDVQIKYTNDIACCWRTHVLLITFITITQYKTKFISQIIYSGKRNIYENLL